MLLTLFKKRTRVKQKELGSHFGIWPMWPEWKLDHIILDRWSNVHIVGVSSRSWRAEQRPCRTNMMIWGRRLPRDDWKSGILCYYWCSLSTHNGVYVTCACSDAAEQMHCASVHHPSITFIHSTSSYCLLIIGSAAECFMWMKIVYDSTVCLRRSLMEDLETQEKQILNGWKELEDEKEIIELKEVCARENECVWEWAQQQQTKNPSAFLYVCVCVCVIITRLRKPSSSVYLTRF